MGKRPKIGSAAPGRLRTSTYFDDSHSLEPDNEVRPVPAYLLIFPYICRMSNLDDVYDLGVDFSARCSWTLRQTQTWHVVGLWLDLDSPSNLDLLQVPALRRKKKMKNEI